MELLTKGRFSANPCWLDFGTVDLSYSCSNNCYPSAVNYCLLPVGVGFCLLACFEQTGLLSLSVSVSDLDWLYCDGLCPTSAISLLVGICILLHFSLTSFACFDDGWTFVEYTGAPCPNQLWWWLPLCFRHLPY